MRTVPKTNPVITDASCSSTHILRNPCGHVSRTGRYINTRWDGNISEPGKGPVMIGGTTAFPTRTIIQDIVNPHGSTGSVEVGDTKIFDTSIDGNLVKNGDSTPIFSNLIDQELSHNSRTDIYLLCRVDFTSNDFVTKAPDFMHLGLPSVNTSDALRSFGTPATIFGRPTDESN